MRMADDYEVIDEKYAIYRNKHGVIGAFYGTSPFIPVCCQSCGHLNCEEFGMGSGRKCGDRTRAEAIDKYHAYLLTGPEISAGPR